MASPSTNKKSSPDQLLADEFEYIRRGGKKFGLVEHYKHACKLIWPHIEWHRWTELANKEIRRPGAKVTVLMGPGSSSKTNTSGWEYLIEYYINPDETLVLISSTDIRGLELRVWGEIKKLHQMAVDRFPWLPGNLIDSKHCIATDELDDDDAGERIRTRDLRKGIIGIPTVQGGKNVGLGKWQGIKQRHLRLIADDCTAMNCFPKGTLVDTPHGKIPIENIKKGDVVFSAVGVSTVKKTMWHRAKCLIRIKTKDGRQIVCTPNHPVFTQKGWEKAGHINQSCYIISTYEAMQILRETIPANQQREMLSEVQGKEDSCGLQTMRKDVSETTLKFHSTFLRTILQGEVAIGTTGIQKEILHARTLAQDSKNKVGFLQDSSRGIREDARKDGEWISKLHSFFVARTKSGKESQNIESVKGNRTQACNPLWKRNWPDETGVNPVGNFLSSCKKQLSRENWKAFWKWIPNLLQSGCCFSRYKTCRGSRWRITRNSETQGTGCQENQPSNGSWVDSVEIYEQENFRRYAKREGRIAVYNLEIEGHPSYSVSGFLVHNSTFLSAFANLNNNIDFQAIVVGNPDDVLDPLGVAAEPKDGWTSHLEPTKTEVWDTQFFNGRCINFVGTDSPNFDYPSDQSARYPYLVSHQKIQETLSAFPKDSFEYYSQCIGVMKISQLSRRIITRDLCRQFHAADDAVWSGEATTKIAALDAAYGGDRCVGGYAEFGKCMDGKVRLQFHPPHIVPVRIKTGEPLAEEDSISDYEKHFCNANGIPPENFFHDSTGRGSLGTSLGRRWSNNCNPVEFGGAPTKRPVTMDTFTIDRVTQQRRLKRCDEHYSKFVTELWYSLRYAIEADQMRGLPEDVMNELCMRQWESVANDKKEAESKLEMKERTRKSPDLGDWAAIILEGARRRGFQISRLGGEPKKDSSPSWLTKKADAFKELVGSRELARS